MISPLENKPWSVRLFFLFERGSERKQWTVDFPVWTKRERRVIGDKSLSVRLSVCLAFSRSVCLSVCLSVAPHGCLWSALFIFLLAALRIWRTTPRGLPLPRPFCTASYWIHSHVGGEKNTLEVGPNALTSILSSRFCPKESSCVNQPWLSLSDQQHITDCFAGFHWFKPGLGGDMVKIFFYSNIVISR